MAAILALLLAVWGVYALGSGYWAARDAAVRVPPSGASRESALALVGPRGAGRGDPARPGARRAVALRPLALRLALGLGEQAGDYGAAYYGLERLGTAPDQPTDLLLLRLGGLGCALACEPAGGAAAAAWRLGRPAACLANPYWWPLPMPLAGRVDLVTVVAALAFPLAVAAAYALAGGWRRPGRARWPRAAPAGALVIVLGGRCWAAGSSGTSSLPRTRWSARPTRPRRLAARQHAGARVAVRTVIFPWAPDYVVGVDGGYWLPLLAGRATTVLPMLYPGERGADPAATAAMIAVARALRDAPAAPETARLLRALGVGYVYDSGRGAARARRRPDEPRLPAGLRPRRRAGAGGAARVSTPHGRWSPCVPPPRAR